MKHTNEIFYRAPHGMFGAVVCSCGFATTFTVLDHHSIEAGMAHHERMHANYEVRRIPESVNTSPQQELPPAVDRKT